MSDTTLDEIVRKMVGRERKEFFVKQLHPLGEVVLDCSHLSLRHPNHPGQMQLDDISLQVHRGEVLGIYGLMGAGRTELFESIFGLYPDRTTCSIEVAGSKACIKHPEDAVAQGIALIPEDRKTAGLILDMNIEQNTTLASLADYLTLGLVDEKKEHRAAEDYRQRLGIRSYSTQQLAGELSGGNQQKIVLAKWMLTSPRILLLDEPTRGIDIHAKNEIYRLIDELAIQGMAIVVASSELPEIMAISDRIVTLCNGRIGAEFTHSEFAEEAILKAALPD